MEPWLHHFGGAAAALFWWSQGRIILVKPGPHHFGGAGAATLCGFSAPATTALACMYRIQEVKIIKTKKIGYE
jgi:hypothetical protein